MPEPRVAVIGAGPAGCVAAYELARAGVPVTLYEEQPTPGGRTGSWRYGRVVIDTGAGFLTPGDRLTRAYIRELGLEHQLEKISNAVCFVSGRERSTLGFGTVRGLIGFPFSSWREKLRLVFRLIYYSVRYHSLDYSDCASLANLDDRSLADRALKDLGENLYHYFVRPTFRALLYCECADLSQALMLAMYSRPYNARLLRIRGGMDLLCCQLARAVRLRTLRRVTGLGARGDDRIVVSSSSCEDSSVDHEAVDGVVVATTADRALAICNNLPAALLTSSQREFLASQRYESNIHCVYRAAFPGEVETVGVVPVGPGERDVAAIAIHSAGGDDGWAQLSGDRLVSVYLSGLRSRNLIDRGEPIEQTCWASARDLDETLPKEAESVARFLRRSAIPLPLVGRFREAHRFNQAQQPPLVFAGDYLASPCVETAVATGRNAAMLLLGAFSS